MEGGCTVAGPLSNMKREQCIPPASDVRVGSLVLKGGRSSLASIIYVHLGRENGETTTRTGRAACVPVDHHGCGESILQYILRKKRAAATPKEKKRRGTALLFSITNSLVVVFSAAVVDYVSQSISAAR